MTVILENDPVPPEVAVPDKTPELLNPRPGGNVPVRVKVGAGFPVAVKLKV